jgi:hypothetical protein
MITGRSLARDRVRLFARERENVAQEGFDAWSTGFPGPYRLSA